MPTIRGVELAPIKDPAYADDYAQQIYDLFESLNQNWMEVFIETPTDGDYTLADSVPIDGTILAVRSICTSGTCTATIKVNSTALGGTANAVSTTAQKQTHNSTNTFVIGDDIVLTISANASASNVTFYIKVEVTDND